jgi:hypothetical protein
MRWVGQVAGKGRREMQTWFWWESQKEDHYEDLDVGGRIILEWILKKYDEVIWT